MRTDERFDRAIEAADRIVARIGSAFYNDVKDLMCGRLSFDDMMQKLDADPEMHWLRDEIVGGDDTVLRRLDELLVVAWLREEIGAGRFDFPRVSHLTVRSREELDKESETR